MNHSIAWAGASEAGFSIICDCGKSFIVQKWEAISPSEAVGQTARLWALHRDSLKPVSLVSQEIHA